MAKERDTRSPASGADQPKERKPRASSGMQRGENSKAAKGGKAAGQKPSQRKTVSDRDRRVQDRAYEIWEQEGRPSGREQEHWERAERETERGSSKG